jgi:hypothetical protein
MDKAGIKRQANTMAINDTQIKKAQSHDMTLANDPMPQTVNAFKSLDIAKKSSKL